MSEETNETRNVKDMMGAIMQAEAMEAMQTPLPEAIPESAETRRFAPISLGDWISLCRKADVPHVPARQVATLNRVDCLRFEEAEFNARNEAALQQAAHAVRDGHMLRFDCCAGIDTKTRAAEGLYQWHPDTQRISIGDPRAYDIFFEHPREEIPVWERPWIAASIVADYPVEYRVFVENGKVSGISNYYPQRPLPHNQRHLDTVTNLAERLIQSAEPPFLWNRSPMLEYFSEACDPEGIHFTADFIVDESDNVLFLEGGPPHKLGAHPCCFNAGDTTGIALSPRYDFNAVGGA